ncbi:anti-sigma factor [Microbacterium xanthum]|uniref:anti-sigma factor n=1 Tax=Microbacterium xanthum TaxID=3079794 RepID=UPI002AD408D7|nr:MULTISPECIES: anti-sigma factor [unclassified Microbacterium]MDZ8172227.1 anti-sigma factor [Microbacterium sp. KSW-48]MDZ8202055.1 anti-sigma factor [Microbacterium sp. SSW1-59]
MSHLDADRLALVALGEDADAGEMAHLQECSLCATEFAELSRAVLVGRSTLTVGDLESPPDRVWDRIAEEVGMTPTPAPDVLTETTEVEVDPVLVADPSLPVDEPVGSSVPPASSEPTGVREQASAGEAEHTPERRGVPRWTKMMFALAASIAAVLAVVGVTSVLRPAPTELAAAALDAFPNHPGAYGSAVVVEDPDGERLITVQLDADDAATDAYREVWLITADASEIVSLGVLEGAEGTFTIPDDIDIDEYVLVDISEEPLDGDPTHSGDSIVRGELESV